MWRDGFGFRLRLDDMRGMLDWMRRMRLVVRHGNIFDNDWRRLGCTMLLSRNWFMTRRLEHCGRLGFRRRRIVEERRDERLLFSLLDFEVKGSIGAARRLAGLGMTPAHHGGIEPFFENLAAAGFEHGLAAQNRRAMRLLVEIGLEPIGLFGGE